MTQCYRFVVSGRVQGVFFRQSAVELANRLGLDGWVRNRADGRVDGLASGAPEAVEQFRSWLRRGPPAARIERVEWAPAEEEPDEGFVVRY